VRFNQGQPPFFPENFRRSSVYVSAQANLHSGPVAHIFPSGIANVQAHDVGFLPIHRWRRKRFATFAPGEGDEEKLTAQQPMQW